MLLRPLVLVGAGEDPGPALELAEALAGDARSWVALVCAPPVSPATFGEPDLLGLERTLKQGDDTLATLRSRVVALGRTFEGEVVVDAPRSTIDAAIEAHHPDLVVVGRLGFPALESAADLAIDVARRRGIACGVPGSGPSGLRAPMRFLHLFNGRLESLGSIGALLRRGFGEADSVVLVLLAPYDAGLVGTAHRLSEVAGVRAHIEATPFEGGWLAAAQGLVEIARRTGANALLLSTEVGGVAAEIGGRLALRKVAHGPLPIVFAPPIAAGMATPPEPFEALDTFASDPVVVRLEKVGTFGRVEPLEDQPLQLVQGGRSLASARSEGGRLCIPRAQVEPGPLGVARVSPGQDPLNAIEGLFTVCELKVERVALVDAGLSPEHLAAARSALAGEQRLLVAVRLDASLSVRRVRELWSAAGLAAAPVLDVRDLLDEGDATDVPGDVAPVRLARAAARLRAAGVSVDAVISASAGRLRASGFAVLDPASLGEVPRRIAEAYRPPPAGGTSSLEEWLDATTASVLRGGHRVQVELDNGAARAELLSLIDGARERVHAQWYIVEDDEVARQIEAALVAAGARGVAVRVLVDSLYSLHGSLGAENALLARLARSPGIELRSSRPIDHLPTLEDLKQRDHRKVLVVDGLRALVSGRNLGHEYYRSFDEARVTTASTYRELPWLDASARIEGPAVADLDEAFAGAWVEAGGARPAPKPPRIAAEPGSRVRVVNHRGLADAYTLEAYLAIVRAARSRLVIVNSFPLQIEVQHALLAAVTRGVRLSMLVGHLRPLHGDDVPFSGGAIRSIADVLIRSRLTALIDAGANVRELALALPGSGDPDLGLLRPHVHAKVVLADARVLAIGSANLDITAGYWESETLVVVVDPSVAEPLAAKLEAILAGSTPIDPAAAKWRQGAEFRAWVGRLWPSILG